MSKGGKVYRAEESPSLSFSLGCREKRPPWSRGRTQTSTCTRWSTASALFSKCPPPNTAAQTTCCPDRAEKMRGCGRRAQPRERASVGFSLHRTCTLGLYLERRTLAGRAAVSRNHRATVLNHKSGGEETRKMWMAPIRRQHPLRLVSEA